MLTSIRVPTNDWNVAIYRKLGPSNKLTDNDASYCFLADTEKNIITSLKLCFAGPFLYTNKELETKYLGTRLPLSDSEIEDFISIAEKGYDELAKEKNSDEILKKEFLNLIAFSLHELT